MKRIIIFIFYLLAFTLIKAQTPISFIEVDTATYNAYLKGDWNRIIKTGNFGIENNIDYYYLRLRIAYSFYMKEQYRSAIPHYKKALQFNENDAIALEFLYRCYLYASQYNDAEKLVKNFSSPLKKQFNKKDSKILTGLSFYTSFGTGGNPDLKNEISNSLPSVSDGTQVFVNGFKNFNLNLSHRFKHSIIAHHSLNLLFKESYSAAIVDGFSYISESQEVRQISYGLVLDVTPVHSITVSPLFTYINYRIPIFYDYGLGTGKNREVFEYRKFQEYVLGVKGTKHFKLIQSSLAFTHSNLNNSKQNTVAGSLAYYPWSNLNLYYTGSAYWHLQNKNSNTLNQFIHSHKVGAKLLTNLWLEVYGILGEFTNFHDSFSSLTYNSLEQYKFLTGANIIVPFFKHNLSLLLSYRYNQSKSIFVPKDKIFEYSNNKDFNYQSITGGLSWKI